jgi:C4-dicarboxylate-specific signal transduction histidine kinase
MQRREQELREKQEQLVQAAKLATLGELTTGVAHELNNPLNNTGLFVGNVIDRIELGKLDPDHVLHDLNKAMEQVHKASQIIAHLRTFGRVAPSSREPVSVDATIIQALSLLQEQLRLRDIEVLLELTTEDARVLGNAIQLEQVFLNLLTNARDALVESPCKSIHITTYLKATTIEIVVKDTGPGMTRDIERRVFDPFFTTKGVGAGTGLGLSIAYGIVRDHEGTIWLDNTPGEGASFVIELPVMTGAGAQG